jgi:ribosomal subunit interface protein
MTNFDMHNISPEVKSYIYQTIQEFEAYATPETMVAVVARESKKKGLHRIAITLMEGEGKVEQEGEHEDLYVAIKLAKENLLKVLNEIQDQVISNQDRTQQINSILGSNQTLH